MIKWLKSTLRRFINATIVPFVKYIVKMAELNDTKQLLFSEIDEIRARIIAKTPDNPCARGFKVYSQTDEDGIIQDILGRIPNHSRTFVEIGCGSGDENNTHYLALLGYKGYWIDGNANNLAFIKEALGGLSFDNLLIRHKFVTRENIELIVKDFVNFFGTDNLGLFSLDMDGNDLYVLEEMLKYVKPLVLCVEYNAKFPPPVSLSIRYEPGFRYQAGDYVGASLQAFCDLLVDYILVSCNLSGLNAFFVRRDVASEFTSYTPSELYQPRRPNLTRLDSVLPPTLNWLRDETARHRNTRIDQVTDN
jgi:hypothetical protein